MDFNLRLILHLCGIFLNILLLSYCLLNTTLYISMLILAIIFVFQIVALISHINTTNRYLARFLTAVNYGDFTQSFKPLKLNSSFKDLGHALDQLFNRLRKERGEKEAQAAYLRALVDQLPIALLALAEDGTIHLSNKSFRKLVQEPEITRISQIEAFSVKLAHCLASIQPGRQESLEINRKKEKLYLTISSSILRNQSRHEKLITIQNIQSQLEAKEIESWQNLIRVMTHEIMNSITPIASLADTSGQYIQEAIGQLNECAANDDDINGLLNDAAYAVNTIGKRGQGLLRFVESYRSLTRLPTPKLKRIRVTVIFKSISELMTKQAQGLDLTVVYQCKPENLEIIADPDLIEQALINLIGNALDAVMITDSPSITVTARLAENSKVVLEVSDNGSGIAKENLDNIFIPFFTTKREGSGIGMSIVKQIVNLHGGSIVVDSSPGQGSSFKLLL